MATTPIKKIITTAEATAAEEKKKQETTNLLTNSASDLVKRYLSAKNKNKNDKPQADFLLQFTPTKSLCMADNLVVVGCSVVVFACLFVFLRVPSPPESLTTTLSPTGTAIWKVSSTAVLIRSEMASTSEFWGKGLDVSPVNAGLSSRSKDTVMSEEVYSCKTVRQNWMCPQ